MPEGHTIHRLAEDYAARFTGDPTRVTRPQGKFTDAAALLDGTPLERADAHGKHLFLAFRAADWIHIHLGLFGKVNFGDAPAPPASQAAAAVASWASTPEDVLPAPTVKVNGHRKATAGDLASADNEYAEAPPTGASALSVVSTETQQAQFARFQSDAPACDNCGALTVRCGTCYRCFNCGNSMGCS